MNTVNSFDFWDRAVHTSDDQKKRIASAKSSKTTPTSVDRDNMSALFGGSGKLPYQTSLVNCTCGDYIRRKLPCKHIYRLAIELGVLNEKAEEGINKNVLRASQISLEDAIAELENHTDAEQTKFSSFLSSYRFQDDLVFPAVIQESERGLLSCPLLEIVDDPKIALHALKRKEIIALLDNNGISGFKRNTKYDDLIEWCIATLPNLSDIFSTAFALRFSPFFRKAQKKTYTYLLRKFTNDFYFDENMIEHSIPHGAVDSLTIVIQPDGTTKSVYSLDFPDDDVTALLNQFGHNRCKVLNIE